MPSIQNRFKRAVHASNCITVGGRIKRLDERAAKTKVHANTFQFKNENANSENRNEIKKTKRDGN